MSLMVIAPQSVHSYLWEAFRQHAYDLQSIIDPKSQDSISKQVSCVWVLHHPAIMPLASLNFQFDPSIRLFEESIEDKMNWNLSQWDDHLASYGFYFPKKIGHKTQGPQKLPQTKEIGAPLITEKTPSTSETTKAPSKWDGFNLDSMKLMSEEEHEEQLTKKDLDFAPEITTKEAQERPKIENNSGDVQLVLEESEQEIKTTPAPAPAPGLSQQHVQPKATQELKSFISSKAEDESSFEAIKQDAQVGYNLGPLIVVHGKVGGPHGVRTFLKNLPADIVWPILVYQTVKPEQKESFLSQMQKICAIPVSWAQPENKLIARNVYLCDPCHRIQPYGEEYCVVENQAQNHPYEELDLIGENGGIFVILSGIEMTFLMPCVQGLTQGITMIAPPGEDLYEGELAEQLEPYGLQRVFDYEEFLQDYIEAKEHQ